MEKFIIISLLCIILGLTIMRMALLTDLFTSTSRYELLNQQVEDVKKENMILMQEIFNDSSYTTVSRKALEQGFRQATYTYLH